MMKYKAILAVICLAVFANVSFAAGSDASVTVYTPSSLLCANLTINVQEWDYLQFYAKSNASYTAEVFILNDGFASNSIPFNITENWTFYSIPTSQFNLNGVNQTCFQFANETSGWIDGAQYKKTTETTQAQITGNFLRLSPMWLGVVVVIVIFTLLFKDKREKRGKV